MASCIQYSIINTTVFVRAGLFVMLNLPHDISDELRTLV
jgi:hypothetical protein